MLWTPYIAQYAWSVRQSLFEVGYNLAQEVNTEALQMFELFTEHYLYLEPIICFRADVGAQNLPSHLQLPFLHIFSSWCPSASG